MNELLDRARTLLKQSVHQIAANWLSFSQDRPDAARDPILLIDARELPLVETYWAPRIDFLELFHIDHPATAVPAWSTEPVREEGSCVWALILFAESRVPVIARLVLTEIQASRLALTKGGDA